MIYTIGHKNPDTDAIVSPIVWGGYKKKQGIKNTIARCGDLNNETKFVLKTFGVKAPKLVKKITSKDQLIILDHNVYKQAVDGAEQAEIIEVIDHHYIGDFQTEKPIYYRAEPVGSTATIIAEIFQERRYKPTKKEASLLLAGIISDTLLFTSPTTTQIDKKIASWLNNIAKINLKDFAKQMFKAKSDISGMKITEILFKDYKEYEFYGKKLGVGVWETVDIGPFADKKETILKQLANYKKFKKIDYLFFGVVDIYKQNLYLYLVGEDEKELAKKSFSNFKEIEEDLALIRGVVSRKKQMIPALSKNLK